MNVLVEEIKPLLAAHRTGEVRVCSVLAKLVKVRVNFLAYSVGIEHRNLDKALFNTLKIIDYGCDILKIFDYSVLENLSFRLNITGVYS